MLRMTRRCLIKGGAPAASRLHSSRGHNDSSDPNHAMGVPCRKCEFNNSSPWLCSLGGFNLWGFGSALVENVTQNATTFVNTIVETDWQKELNDIQEGLRTETEELEHQVGRQLGIANDGAGTSSASQEDGAMSIADLGRRFISGTAEIFQQVHSSKPSI